MPDDSTTSADRRGRDGWRAPWRVLSRIAARLGMFAAAVLIFAALSGNEARAQGCTFFAPCPAPSVPNASVYAAHQAALFDAGSHFLQRFNAQTSFRTAASAGNNPGGGGADPAEGRYRAWVESYGLAARTSGQGSFPGDHRRTYGVIGGAGYTPVPGATFGVSVEENRSKIDVPSAAGQIDLTQVGGIASFERGPLALGVAVIHGFGTVNSSRFDTGGVSTASYYARLWGAMSELSFYVPLPGNARFVPKLAVDWVRSSTDPFSETGGPLPVTASGVTANRVRLLAGGEIGQSWLVGRTLFDFSVYAKLVDNLAQNIGALTVNDAVTPTAPQIVAGVSESRLGADAGATFSVKISELTRIYAVYDGRFRSNLTSHAGTVGAEFRW